MSHPHFTRGRPVSAPQIVPVIQQQATQTQEGTVPGHSTLPVPQDKSHLRRVYHKGVMIGYDHSAPPSPSGTASSTPTPSTTTTTYGPWIQHTGTPQIPTQLITTEVERFGRMTADEFLNSELHDMHYWNVICRREIFVGGVRIGIEEKRSQHR